MKILVLIISVLLLFSSTSCVDRLTLSMEPGGSFSVSGEIKLKQKATNGKEPVK